MGNSAAGPSPYPAEDRTEQVACEAALVDGPGLQRDTRQGSHVDDRPEPVTARRVDERIGQRHPAGHRPTCRAIMRLTPSRSAGSASGVVTTITVRCARASATTRPPTAESKPSAEFSCSVSWLLRSFAFSTSALQVGLVVAQPRDETARQQAGTHHHAYRQSQEDRRNRNGMVTQRNHSRTPGPTTRSCSMSRSPSPVPHHRCSTRPARRRPRPVRRG